MKNATETFGQSKAAKLADKKFVAAPKFELPQIAMADDDPTPLFENVGKVLAQLHAEDYILKGYVDLDKAWIETPADAITKGLYGDDVDTKLQRYMNQQLENHKGNFPTPFMGNRAYYGQVAVTIENGEKEGEKIFLFKDFADTQKPKLGQTVGEKYPNGKMSVAFGLCIYHSEELGYKAPPAALGGEREEAEYAKINFFIYPETQLKVLRHIEEAQESDQDFRDTEYGFIISPEIKKADKSKYLNGYLNDFWC